MIPRVRDSRYAVRLPDGYVLYEVIQRQETLSLVRLNLDEFPKEVQEKVQREPYS